MRLLILLFASACVSLFSQEHFAQSVLTEQHAPTSSLYLLLESLGVTTGGDLQSIVESTQNHWLQKGKERWEFVPLEEDKKELLLPIFKELRMVDTVNASCNTYDYALIYGATYFSVLKRIKHLIAQFHRGVRFKQVILLTGQRDLNPNENQFPVQTETEMMLALWETTPMPESMRSLPYLLIDTPKQKKNGLWMRPTTKDTLIEWLKTNPVPGTCLFVSNQPYSGYQESVARSVLPATFSIETIGVSADPKLPVAIYLDNLARWLYEEKQRRTSQVGISP